MRDNVAERARPPQVRQRRVSAPSVETVRAIVNAADERAPRLAPIPMLGALTGMRRGELCDLRWSDVDLDRWGNQADTTVPTDAYVFSPTSTGAGPSGRTT